MVHVTFWLPLLLVLFLLRQTNAGFDQCGELQSEISRLIKLNHRNELLVGQCYEQLKTETHVSEAAFRTMKLEEDKSKSKLREIHQLEAENSYLKKQLQEKELVLKSYHEEQKQAQTVIDGLRENVTSLNQTVQNLSEDAMFFYIQSVHSGKYLDVIGGSMEKGAKVIIHEFNGNKNQQWTYKKCRIVNKLNGLVLHKSISGVNEVTMWPENGENEQKWYFDEDMTIRSELGFVLDVKYSSMLNNSPVIIFHKHGGDNQKFRILPVAE